MTLDPTVVVGAITAMATFVTAIVRMVILELRRDRDAWRDAYFGAVGLNEKSIDALERVAKRA